MSETDPDSRITPAIAACFTGGVLRYMVSRNTPPATRRIRVVRDASHVWGAS